MEAPLLSVIVAARNMARELPRTLYTLTPRYQREITEQEYQVIVVDCGSKQPIDEDLVASFGANFHLVRADDSPSPARAINSAANGLTSPYVAICIDGARMLSPGILNLMLFSFRTFEDPTVATLAWHLGPKQQSLSMLEGYSQEAEDRLLNSVKWQEDGYELFRISSFAGSSKNGWFGHIFESNCISMRLQKYKEIGGLDERFVTPGGGYVNIDFYNRILWNTRKHMILLGEGTFHQFHGGASTNIPKDHPRRKVFQEEYSSIKQGHKIPDKVPVTYLGSFAPQSLPFLKASLSTLELGDG